MGADLNTRLTTRDALGNATDVSVSEILSADTAASRAAINAASSAPGSITNAMLASGAAVGALLTAGLGASHSYVKTQNSAATLLASVAGTRSVLIVVVVDQTFADGDTSQTTFQIGQTGTAAKFADTTAFAGLTAGTVKTFAGTLTGTDNLIVTGVPAVGTGTGGITVTVLALPV